MFSLAQIGLGGFFGIYSGCMPLSVNLARLPYWRGAIIGVFFGSLTHMMTALLYLIIMVFAISVMDDPILKKPESWVLISMSILTVQALTAAGCQIMGRYFLSPPKKNMPFERQKLYEMLKSRDDGKKSVLHDVVLLMENQAAPPDVRFSTGWIVLFSAVSVCATILWIHAIKVACLESLFYGIPMDAEWYFNIAVSCLIPWIVLVLLDLAAIFWLCRDCRKTA